MNDAIETIQEAIFNAVITLPAQDIAGIYSSTLSEAADEAMGRAKAAIKVRNRVMASEDAITLPMAMEWLSKAANSRDLHSEIAQRLFYRLHVIEHNGEMWAGCTDGFRLHAVKVAMPAGVYLFWGNKAVKEDAEPVDWTSKVCWDADRELPAPITIGPGKYVELYEWGLSGNDILIAAEGSTSLLCNKKFVDHAIAGMVKARTYAGIIDLAVGAALTLLSTSRLAVIMPTSEAARKLALRTAEPEPD